MPATPSNRHRRPYIHIECVRNTTESPVIQEAHESEVDTRIVCDDDREEYCCSIDKWGATFPACTIQRHRVAQGDRN
eukprot:scaffold124228_cov26-Tisochrysis_lutea.AAC.5